MQPVPLFIHHCLAFAWYVLLCFSLVSLTANVRKARGEDPAFAHLLIDSQWNFLTFQNLVLQAIFHMVSLLINAFILMKNQRIIKIMIPFRDLIFGSLAFPASTFVFVLFWGIYLYDRELICPKVLDPYISSWLNHGMHTSIFPLVLLEIFITPHQYPSVGKSLVILGIASLSYQLWIQYTYAKTGKWIYPIFSKLSPLSMTVFGGISTIFVFFCYRIGRFFNHMIWGYGLICAFIYLAKPFSFFPDRVTQLRCLMFTRRRANEMLMVSAQDLDK